MRRVLILRPEPGASETMERAKALGLDPVKVPLFEIEPVAWQAPEAGGFDGLLLTSANAVLFAGDQLQSLRGLPVYAVGNATATAAREAGFDIASAGDSDVDRLLGSIDAELTLLHLAGKDRKTVDARQAITVVTVYGSTPSAEVDLSAASGSVALIHSPRAARRFAELVADKSSVVIAAISREAAEAAGSGWKRVEHSEAPSDDALLALTERLCNNMPAT